MTQSKWGVLAAVFVAAGLVACSGDSDTPSTSAGSSTPGSNAPVVNVALKEFTISPSPASASAGAVNFKATNGGTVAHELVVLKTDKDPKSLPTKADGGIDEAASNSVGEVSDLEPGKSGSTTLNLAAGRYVLVCNLPGHYAAGMATAFTVK
jgi:uncharacterized cupredoxin-like copper-binding protein